MKIIASGRQSGFADCLFLFIKRRFFHLLVFLLVSGQAVICRGQQQDTIKMMSYNLLNYGSDTVVRNPFFRITMASVNPDILVVQEINTQAQMSGFLTYVLVPATSIDSMGTFINGPDSNNGLFYKRSKFRFLANRPIHTELRDISEFTLVHILSGDTIRIYSVHLKAQGAIPANDEAQRGREVDSLRKVTDALPTGSNFIVCGDFNIYKSTETCYLKLLHDTTINDGNFIDPITMTGTWNNGAYAIHHTQSPRTRAFDGGSTGGLDDRFDLILYSTGISQAGGMQYVANSEIAFGNDGNHYNDSINHPPNAAVSQTIADALHYGSDHIPCIAKFTFAYGSAATVDMGVLSLLNPATSICSNSTQSMQVQVKNFSASTINFSSTSMLVTLQATNPSLVSKTFTKTISSGSLAAGTTLNITFDSLYNMSAAGNYTFNANTTVSGDGNSSNNAMPQAIVTVSSFPTASISPAGPVSICSGSSVVLTASSASNYLWSNGATTQTISVSVAGNYSVTVSVGSGCSATSAPVVVSVLSNPTASVTPPGPISICNGSSFTLTSSNGSSYLWSTGATTQAISVSTAGNYSVSVTGANGCFAVSPAVSVSIVNSQSSGTVFTETMGTVSGTTLISTHESNNGFDNDSLTMSGSGDVRITSASTGYGAGLPTASGSANVFITNIAGRNFIISGINTTGLSNLQLSFGIFKSTSAGTGSDFSVLVADDTAAYVPLSFPSLSTGATWQYRTTSGSIPASSNLKIQFRNDSTSRQYRIDDVTLTYSTPVPVITASGPLALCPTDSVILTSSAGSNYLWSNGATTQSIIVKTAGIFSVTVNCVTSSSVTVTQNSYSITSSTGSNGTINPLGATSVNCGNNLSYSFTPNACYHIANVLVDGVSDAGAIASGTYTFTNVTANHTISVTFAINVYTITSSTGSNGTINPLGVTSVNCGNNLSYSITPNTCYQIANVLVDGVGDPGAIASGTYTFANVTANHTIIVTFAINTYTITSSAGSNGTINPLGTTSVNCGNNLSYAITPDSCFPVADVLIDGLSNPGAVSAGVYTFNNVTSAHTISVLFGNNQCNTGVTLNLQVLIGGFYLTNGLMEAVLYRDNLSSDSTACDSITVELHDAAHTDSVVASAKGLMYTNGNAQLVFPSYILGHNYYLAVRHRNALAIWSKTTVFINTLTMAFDFTRQ